MLGHMADELRLYGRGALKDFLVSMLDRVDSASVERPGALTYSRLPTTCRQALGHALAMRRITV